MRHGISDWGVWGCAGDLLVVLQLLMALKERMLSVSEPYSWV